MQNQTRWLTRAREAVVDGTSEADAGADLEAGPAQWVAGAMRYFRGQARPAHGAYSIGWAHAQSSGQVAVPKPKPKPKVKTMPKTKPKTKPVKKTRPKSKKKGY